MQILGLTSERIYIHTFRKIYTRSGQVVTSPERVFDDQHRVVYIFGEILHLQDGPFSVVQSCRQNFS